MNFSILPILYLVQILVIYRAAGKTHHSGQISVDQTNQINLLLMMLTFWGGLSAYRGEWILSKRYISKFASWLLDYTDCSLDCDDSLDSFKIFTSGN